MSGYNPPSSIDDEKVLHATALNDQGTIAGPVHAVVYAQGPPSNPIYNNQQNVQNRPPGQGIQFNNNGVPVYSQQPGQAPIYAQNAQGLNFQPARRPTGPPTERWRDGICNCCSNLWPSCGCVFICHGAWLLAQTSQKAEYFSFRAIMIPYFVVTLVCIVLSLIFNVLFMFIPSLGVFIFAILVRQHIVRKYNIIDGGGPCNEFVTSFCCYTCSLAQMARHMSGYRKVLDGDSDPTMRDYYDEQQV